MSSEKPHHGRRALVALGIGVAIGSLLTSAVLADRSLSADAETRLAVTAIKQAIVAAHKARDGAALKRLYADDYTAIDSKGNVRSKGDLLASLPTDSEIVEGRYEILAVRRWGSIAVATGRGHFVFRKPDGSTRTADYDSFNVFERRDGEWRYAAAFLP